MPSPAPAPRYGAQSSVLELIYGMTFEIWEERGVDLIRHYYSPDIEFFALSGLSTGVEPIVEGTRATLKAFPDRLLLAENVVASEDANGTYSSHRILSPMRNTGPSIFGAATQRRVQVRTVADCLLRDGQIVREWLMRDNLSLVEQLGFDPLAAARQQRAATSDETASWLRARLDALPASGCDSIDHPDAALAGKALSAALISGDERAFADSYAHFAVSHSDSLRWHSGHRDIQAHYRDFRTALNGRALSVDHIASQPFSLGGRELAVRWSLAVTHRGDYAGLAATGKEAYLLGTSHWRLVNDQIATEWTVFDGIGVLAQLIG